MEPDQPAFSRLTGVTEVSKPMPRIRNVKAEPPRLFVSWKGGGRDTIDLAGWIATGGDLLAPLASPGVFAAARVADYGAAVAWSKDDGDLAIDAAHLELLAEEQKPFDKMFLVEWQETAGLSNREAADFLDVSVSTFDTYKAGAKIPAVVAMVCRAASRDPILLQAHYKPRRVGRPRKIA
jgi:hypothetical protein